MTTLSALKALRRLLNREGGWCQGAFVAKRPGRRGAAYCLLGGVGHIAGEDWECGANLRGALLTALPYRMSGLMTYNDMSSTTQEDVVALIDRAIATLRSAPPSGKPLAEASKKETIS